jgi:hypothetical protein
MIHFSEDVLAHLVNLLISETEEHLTAIALGEESYYDRPGHGPMVIE